VTNAAPTSSRKFRIPWADLVLLVMLAVAFITMSLLSPNFLTLSNLLEVTRFSTEIGLIAIGMTLVIITGGIDLSVGAILGLCGIVLGMLTVSGVNVWIAAVLSVLLGAALGAFNGLVTSRIGIPPLIVTLATMAIYRGFSLGLSQARSFGEYPEGFFALGQGYMLGLPTQLWLLVILAVLASLFLSRHAIGRLIYAVGNNATAARFAGAPVGAALVIVYTISGALSAIAGVVYTSRLSSARADAGIGFELDAITAVVLGGTAIMGGSGSVVGTMLGLVLVGVVRNGLTLAFVPAEQQAIIIGLILLFAVLSDQFLRSKQRR
jgi:rhamnose transport system permease protein